MRTLAIAVSFTLALLLPGLAGAAELTLEKVIELTLARNERARIADAQVASADAAVSRARAGFLPSVTLTGSETVRPYQVERDGAVLQRWHSASGALTVAQPLLDPTAFPAYAAAKHEREAARHGAESDRRALAFEAARAFFLALAEEQVREAAQRRLERAEASLLSAKAQAAAQIASSNDVTRAQIERASAARSLAGADGDLRRAKIELGYLIDAPVDGALRPPGRALAAAPRGSVPALVARAVPSRPDVLAARESAAAAQAAADEPGLRFVPSLDLVGRVSVQDRPIDGDRYVDTTLSLNLAWTIWDGGLRGADADARRAAADLAELQHKAQRRRVAADVQAAVAALESAEAALSVAEEAAGAARRGAEEAAVLYREGLARAIELVDANLQRFESEVGLAQARLDVAQAQLDLRAALGLFPLDEKR
ncbi:TolC family protein [Sorangium sp. So ce136]|uniref:TolC family protein n=1 Tax=Sorangium sp. So ce136 TaxID=3133284 RepID=UPI003EFFC149